MSHNTHGLHEGLHAEAEGHRAGKVVAAACGELHTMTPVERDIFFGELRRTVDRLVPVAAPSKDAGFMPVVTPPSDSTGDKPW